MKCLVTGGNGYIGSHVVRKLKENNHEVIVLDIVKGNNCANVDITDTKVVKNVILEHKPEYVFHIAAVADARKSLADPVGSVHINIGGTASILEASRGSGVKRVILASSCWVANAMQEGMLDETSLFVPGGGGHVYTTTKIASELLAHDFNKLYGVPFTILRYGIPYGPGMWQGLVLRSFLDNIFAGRPITIHGDGSQSRRFLFIEDLAEAHVLAIQEAAENQTYNLEGMRFVSIKELAQVVAKMIGNVKIEFKEEPQRVGEFKYFRKVISSHKAYVDLGWEPKVDLEEGVRRTVSWYQKEIAIK
jgi:UDP-glucose 4-epimerase